MKARILDSARKHGVSDSAIDHGLKLPLRIIELEPPLILIIAPGPAGNLLELIVADPESDPRVIHAMKLRPQFYSYL